MKLNLDLKNILGIASLVGSLVKAAQSLGGKTGAEKHDIVVGQVGALLPVIEGLTGQDVADDALYASTLSALVAAEKAVLVARAQFAALLVDIKAKAK